MIEYLKYFFNPSHLLTLRPPAMQGRALIILGVAFGILIIIGVISKMMAKKTNDGLKMKGWERLFHLFLTIGILGFVYLAFAWQGVILLAGRFWLIILEIIAIVWLAFIGKYMYLEVPKLRKKINKERNFDKYIP